MALMLITGVLLSSEVVGQMSAEYQNGLKCVITHSQFGTDLLVPRSYSQEELKGLLPQVLGSLKIQDSVKEYYAPFKETNETP